MAIPPGPWSHGLSPTNSHTARRFLLTEMRPLCAFQTRLDRPRKRHNLRRTDRLLAERRSYRARRHLASVDDPLRAEPVIQPVTPRRPLSPYAVASIRTSAPAASDSWSPWQPRTRR